MSNAGQFKSGSEWRGNPNGRPKGSKDIRVDLTYKMLKAHVPYVEKLLMDAALKAEAGNEGWQRWYLDRMLPKIYGNPKTEIEIEGFKESPDLSGATNDEIAKIYESLSAIMNREVSENGQ